MRFHFENDSDSENELNIILCESGGIRVSVAEEMAMDSYNQTFDCAVQLDKVSAVNLRDFLIEHFPLPPNA